MLKKISLVVLPVLISACASTGSSFSQSESASAATIKGYWNRESAFTWEGYGLLSVDDKFISPGLFGDPATATTKIEPGSRKIVVAARFNKGFGTGPFEAMVPMDVELKPSAEYQLKGIVSGTTVETWLENISNNEKSSNTFKAAYGKSAPPPAPIPIFIPAR